jgi:alpha-amylase
MGPNPIANNKPTPLNEPSSYHPQCTIDYSNQSSIENCQVAGLPDINTRLPSIRTMFQGWIQFLVKEYRFDGVRIDTVKHVEKDFFSSFVSTAGVYTIGEVFDGSPEYLAGYAGLMDGVLNYAVYYPMNNFYQQKGSAQTLVDMLNTVNSSFPDPSALGTFLDNHDNPRWLNQKNDIPLLKNALAFVILSRGIPIMYYGTEQGFSGGADPANREDLWRSGFNTQSDLYQTISKLIRAKKRTGGLAANDLKHLYVTNNAYAWSRAGGDLIVLTTNTGAGSSGNHCFNTQKPNGRWENISGNSVTSDGSGNICLAVTNGEPVVLTNADNPANPTVTEVAPTPSVTSVCPESVLVTFNHKVTTAYGESIMIAGNVGQLGNWTVAQAPKLSAAQYTANNPVWSVELKLPSGQQVQYKFVRVASGGSITWEGGDNRVYAVPLCVASASVESSWR